MAPDSHPFARRAPRIEAGCGAVLLRLPCGTAVTLDHEAARQTGLALIEAGRCSAPRRNPQNMPDKPVRDRSAMPLWLFLPLAFLFGAGVLLIPSLMFAEPSTTLVLAAVIVVTLVVGAAARGALSRQAEPRPTPPPRPARRTLRLVGGRDLATD